MSEQLAEQTQPPADGPEGQARKDVPANVEQHQPQRDKSIYQTLDPVMCSSGKRPKPDTNTKHLRIYSHPLDMFCQKVLFTLAAKKIQFQYCTMDTYKKSQWHNDLCNGFLPIIENVDGTLVFEASVLWNFASDMTPHGTGMAVWPHEAAEPGNIAAAFETAQMKLDIQSFEDKFFPKLYAAYVMRYVNPYCNEDVVNLLPDVEQFLNKHLNGKEFLSGTDQPQMIDFNCFPLLERVVMLENTVWSKGFKDLNIKERAPIMYDYVHRFRKLESMKEYCIQEQHYKNMMNEYDEIWYNSPFSHAMVQMEGPYPYEEPEEGVEGKQAENREDEKPDDKEKDQEEGQIKS